MTPFARWLIWTSSVATGTTGVVYWWMKNLMEPLNEWAVINHPLQPWVLKAHIVSAPVLVFAVGLIATNHIWKHFQNAVRLGRRSGVTTMWVVGPMIISGYLIQAVTHPSGLAVVVWLHVLTGLIYLTAFGLHQVAARRARPNRTAAGSRRGRDVARQASTAPREPVHS